MRNQSCSLLHTAVRKGLASAHRHEASQVLHAFEPEFLEMHVKRGGGKTWVMQKGFSFQSLLDPFVPGTSPPVVSTGLSPDSICNCLFPLLASHITHWEQKYQVSAEHFHFKDNRH